MVDFTTEDLLDEIGRDKAPAVAKWLRATATQYLQQNFGCAGANDISEYLDYLATHLEVNAKSSNVKSCRTVNKFLMPEETLSVEPSNSEQDFERLKELTERLRLGSLYKRVHSFPTRYYILNFQSRVPIESEDLSVLAAWRDFSMIP